jgi:hypothetical protein
MDADPFKSRHESLSQPSAGFGVTNQSGRLDLNRVSIGLFPLQIPPRGCVLRSATPNAIWLAMLRASA